MRARRGVAARARRPPPTLSRWFAACVARCISRGSKRLPSRADTRAPTTSAPSDDGSRALMQPQPAIPPFEPPPLPALITESGRRILWIIGVYRAICGALLLGTAIFFDLRTIGIGTPNAFLTAAGLYFMFAMAVFWWVQRESLLLPLPALLLSLLFGDIF